MTTEKLKTKFHAVLTVACIGEIDVTYDADTGGDDGITFDIAKSMITPHVYHVHMHQHQYTDIEMQGMKNMLIHHILKQASDITAMEQQPDIAVNVMTEPDPKKRH